MLSNINHTCKASAVLWVPILVGGMALLLMSLRHCGMAGSEHGVYTYSRDDVEAVLHHNGVDMDSVRNVQRTWDSTGLLVTGHRAGIPTCVLIRPCQAARSWAIPTTICWMDRNNDPVAWRRQMKDQVVLATGDLIPLPPFAVFDVDPSGNYFLIGEKPMRTWIGSIRKPWARWLASDDMLGLSVFATSNTVYVTGSTYARDPFRSASSARCLVFKDTEDSFVLMERHDFSSAHAVLDLAQDGETLLLKAGGDLYSRLVVYDMKSRKQTRVGTAKAFSFLLVSDPAAPPVDDELEPTLNQ